MNINNFFNLIISFLGFLKVYSISSYKKNKILCFHDVSDYNWEYSINKKLFYSLIKELKKNHKFTSLTELIRAPKNSGLVAITFDDGYKSILLNAYPILKSLNIPATLFVLSDPGQANRTELSNSLELLNYKQLEMIYKTNWEIESHSITHPNLLLTKKADLTYELENSKSMIENQLKSKVVYFAFPKGKYNDTVVNAVKNSGYKACFTVDGSDYKLHNNDFIYSRILIENNKSINYYKMQLSDFGLIIQKIQFLISKLIGIYANPIF